MSRLKRNQPSRPSGETHLFHRIGLPIREAMFLFALAVGLSSGLAAYVFFWMIEFAIRSFVHLHHNTPSLLTRAILLISPALGGLMTGYLLHVFAPDAKGGVSEVIDAMLHRDGFIRTRVGFFKSLASAICIGSGGSAGREGPVVQIGASVGSTLAQVFRVTRRRAQILVACGAAAGIAAVFNAPIAGAFFAAEVITGNFQMRELSLLFTASAAGAVVARGLLWKDAAFPMPAYNFQVGWALLFYLALGVLTAAGGHLFILVLHGIDHRFRLSRIPEVWRPAAGGLAVGIIGVGLNRTEVFGTGAEFMERTFSGYLFARPDWGHLVFVLLLLFAAKMLATSFTLGSGGSGGDLMPSLFLGGALGGAYGLLVHAVFPGSTLPPAAYALVGAAAFFSGVAHAPITGIVLGIEMGWDYGLVLPLMAACSVSALVSSRLRTASIYTLKLEERGVDVIAARGGGPDPLQSVRVEEVMTQRFRTVRPDLAVTQLLDLFVRTGHHGFVVTDEERRLLGMVTLSDAQRGLETEGKETSVEHVMSDADDLITCYPTQTLRQVVAALGSREVGRIPVVDVRDAGKVVGILRRGDILRGISNALSHPGEAPAVGPLVGGQLTAFDVRGDDPRAGRSVGDIDVPPGVVLVSLVRRGETEAPRGSTVLEPGDHVVAFVEDAAARAFQEWAGPPAVTTDTDPE